MKKDNRIIRPEQMTEEEMRSFIPVIEKVLEEEDKKFEKFKADQAAERARKLASGEYIEKDRKIYDVRYIG